MNVTLTYFDFSGSRGEECRLALHIAGISFTDDRIDGAAWGTRKSASPWGNLPVLTVDGRELGQSNAILQWVGRTAGLIPADPWEAARHEAILAACEELRHSFMPAMREKDPALKQAAREAFAAGYLQAWGANMEAQLGKGPFVGGAVISVADLKVYMCVNWFVSGVVDHIGTDVFAAFPKLLALHAAVKARPDVVAWYAR
ncbi:MAG: glutathione S-transferase [Myxococcota bacterium]|jgi:glutathione S-transferase